MKENEWRNDAEYMSYVGEFISQAGSSKII